MLAVGEGHGGMVAGGLQLLLLVVAARTFSPTDPIQLGLGVDPPTAPDGDRPWFQTNATTNVTALLGRTAYLGCRVRQLANRTVTWVRMRDVHLLTVGRSTYTNDERFRVRRQGADWTLQVKFVQHRDAGAYACQVSASPPLSYLVYLTVVEPVTEILGGPELYIDAESTINLTCVVRQSPEPPSFIFWKHNDQVISYDSSRGGISMVSYEGDITVSTLLIQHARPSDSGEYSCQPSGTAARSLRVHVLQGEKPAAMQTSSSPHLPGPLVALVTLLHLLHWAGTT